MRNFKSSPLQDENDIDRQVYERTITGRLTYERYKILERYCRKHCWRMQGHCCDHDCCGHKFAHDMEMKVDYNPKITSSITFIYTEHFNY